MVAYTKVVALDETGWSEDWYLQSCGALKVTRIDFTFDEDGVGFAFAAPCDLVGGEAEG